MAQEPDVIKLVVYDFDQTISCDHIYHKLDATAKLRSGKGQTDELDEMELDDVHELFGGQDRISRLNLHFQRVTSSAEIVILSFGYVSVIRQSLNLIKLAEYFENVTVIGCDSMELKQVHGNKAQCIQQMRKKKDLNSDQVLFVDDDATNIRKAKALKACKTVEIKPRNGMSNDHMMEIEKIIGVFEIEKQQLKNESETSNSSFENNEKNGTNSNNSSTNHNENENGNGNENDNENTNRNDNTSNDIGMDGDNNNNNNNNSNNNDNNNDENNNDNNSSNNNSNSTDDSKEPMNRQPSWKVKYMIDKDKDNLLDRLINGNNEDSDTPVVDVSVNHESDSEANDTVDFVLTTPVLPNGNKD